VSHARVEAHFAGQTTPAEDRAMWRHLSACPACRERYHAHALLEAIDDGDGRARARRMQRGVFGPAPRRRRWVAGAAASVALACAALVIVVRAADDRAFRARGDLASNGEAAAHLLVYRVTPNGEALRAGSTIGAGDALAFAYVNPRGARHLMVFAVDGAGRVHWYWPAWRRADEAPVAVPIRTGTTPIELGEAVRHPLAPGPITIYAVFSSEQHRVRDWDAVAARAPGELAAAGDEVWSERLEVTP
jgi:hypothetical protein